MSVPLLRARGPMPRACRALVLAAGVILVPIRARAATIFALADRSQVITEGVVRDVTSYKNGAFQVFSIEPERVLKGPASVGQPLAFVQEIVVPSDRPYFAVGERTLVFAVPLP